MGLVPSETALGDTVCVLTGAEVPFILRKASTVQGEDRRFLLVGDFYIHGMMNGEALEADEDYDIALQ